MLRSSTHPEEKEAVKSCPDLGFGGLDKLNYLHNVITVLVISFLVKFKIFLVSFLVKFKFFFPMCKVMKMCISRQWLLRLGRRYALWPHVLLTPKLICFSFPFKQAISLCGLYSNSLCFSPTWSLIATCSPDFFYCRFSAHLQAWYKVSSSV